jgi:dTDP-4-amino-4,6-dideoxygalactose transaminase
MNEYSAPVNFIDLVAQQKLIRHKIDLAINNILDHGQYIMGPEVAKFESQLCDFTGSKNTLTCANGTDALSLVLMAWNVGPGDAIFVPSFTYVATAEAAAQLGATPFFVDVTEDTFNIDPESFKQAIFDCKKLHLKPKVVIPVDLFGRPANVKEIYAISKMKILKCLLMQLKAWALLLMAKWLEVWEMLLQHPSFLLNLLVAMVMGGLYLLTAMKMRM